MLLFVLMLILLKKGGRIRESNGLCLCNIRPQKHQPQNLNTSGVDYKPGMHVPSTVLDKCNNSFMAADSNCVKAS